jgi:hypothetical protein
LQQRAALFSVQHTEDKAESERDMPCSDIADIQSLGDLGVAELTTQVFGELTFLLAFLEETWRIWASNGLIALGVMVRSTFYLFTS